eukprot:jgi/Tetstr1/459160/TSEL_004606.t1
MARQMPVELAPKSRGGEGKEPATGSGLDARLSKRMFTQLGGRVPRGLLMTLEHSGNGLIWIPAAAALTFGGQGGPSPVSVWAANLLLALLLDVAAVCLLKGIVRRARPAYNDSSDFLTVATVDSFSFPSGHSSRMSMVAGLALMAVPPSSGLTGLLVLLWALAVALSRVVLGRHYLTDVAAGVLLGVAVTAAVSQSHFSGDELLLTEQHVAEARRAVGGMLAGS